jgi:hypothetical protein
MTQMWSSLPGWLSMPWAISAGGTSDAQSRLAPTHSRVVLVKIPLEVQ